jgi:8-amino-7-oxononanoate synthase
MISFEQQLEEKLEALRANNNFRELRVPNPTSIDFTSNDYLGLARSKTLAQDIERELKSIDAWFPGSTGSRLLSGNSEYTQNVEKKLAEIFNGEAALIFNSGYNANLAVLSSIPQKRDLVLYDERVHASIKDGLRLSLATRFPYKHNDPGDLEAKLKRSGYARKYIVAESIYSMDGDQCPLSNYVDLSEKYNASIILDEAHSTGVMGINGNALANSMILQSKIDIRIYTFGKAMGTHGACVVGSQALIHYLINTARPFIYTTALPIHAIASIKCSFEFLKRNMDLQTELAKKVDLFLSRVKAPKQIVSSSAIQCIVIPGNVRVRQASDLLQKNGFDIRPILSPTVPRGSERLRICLHTYNSENEIIGLASALNGLASHVN